MEHAHSTATTREPWNKGKLVGQKAPFKVKEIWAIRVRLSGRSNDCNRAVHARRQSDHASRTPPTTLRGRQPNHAGQG
jgi:hypothetical protein